MAADPGHIDAWYGLASARRKSGRCDRAIVAYRRYAQLVPTHVRAVLRARGLPEGRPATRPARSRRSSTTSRSSTGRKSKHWIDHANGLIAELSAAAPPAAKARERRRRRPLRRRSRRPRSHAAEASRRTAGRVDRPAGANMAYVEAQALRDRGQIDDAIAKFRRPSRPTPSTCCRAPALGELLLKIRRDDEAIEVFRAARRQEPDLFARLVRAGVRVAGQGARGRGRGRLPALHQAQAERPRPLLRTRARASRTWGGPPRPGAPSDLRLDGETPGRKALGRIRDAQIKTLAPPR